MQRTRTSWGLSDMLTNCAIFAFRLFFRRGGIGYIGIRSSHWGRFPHFFYAERHHIVQYVPLNPKLKTCPPPVFRGRVKWGGEVVGHSGFSPLEGWAD